MFLFDILSIGDHVAFDAGLRELMESTKVQKVCIVAHAAKVQTSEHLDVLPVCEGLKNAFVPFCFSYLICT